MFPTMPQTLTSIIIAASITLALKLLNWLWFKPRKLEKLLRKQGLNGNHYRPFLGDIKDLTTVIKTQNQRSIKVTDDPLPHIFAYYHEIVTKFGKNSFIWFGPWPRLNISDPELIKEILNKPDIYQKPLPEMGKILTGGILSHEGEKWAKHRKIINPAFHLEKLKNMVPAIGLCCSNMVDRLKCKVSSSNEGACEIDIWPYFEDLTGDVISRTAFGSNYEQGRRIFQLQREKIKLVLQLLEMSLIPGWRFLPTKANMKLKKITNELQSLLRGIIDKRQKDVERGEVTPYDNDLLGLLMESNSDFSQEDGNKNGGMSVEDVIEECKLFFFAGSETTACLLVWAIVLLCQHPEWQTRAREEVIHVFGKSLPTSEGLNHIKTVTMILQEVLRLYPPVPLTARRPTETVKLGNLIIPEGVHLTLLMGLHHYDSEIWGDDVKEFKPQRFSEGVSKSTKIQSSFVPFSSGPRVCIGQNFAMIEAKMALSMILQRFSFELSPSYLHAPSSIITLHPQFGAPIILRSL